ncbi:glycoside hydrolase family 25 protein, partial [Multifurca ochricompacta]
FVALSALSVVATPLVKRSDPQGVDVSHWQGTIDWNAMAANGISFSYIKATEGTIYSLADSHYSNYRCFSANYDGAASVGIIRGAYHYAHPDISDGATQANFFLGNGGGWSGDGITLPGAIDLEKHFPPDGCYSLSQSDMVSWISDFSNTYFSTTSRYPVIYTTTSWWIQCTGNSADLSSNNPLWIAEWASTLGSLPAGWRFTTFWQYADSGPNPGDQDLFNGDITGLQRYGFTSLCS